MTRERPADTIDAYYFCVCPSDHFPVTYSVELELLREDLSPECWAYLERRAVEVWESVDRVRFVFWFEFTRPLCAESRLLRWIGVLRWRLMRFGVFRGRVVWNVVFGYSLCLRENREAEFWEGELPEWLGTQRN